MRETRLIRASGRWQWPKKAGLVMPLCSWMCSTPARLSGMRGPVVAASLLPAAALAGCSPVERGMVGLTLDESSRIAAVVWTCSEDDPVHLSVFQSAEHDFVHTPDPENVEDLFGAGVDLVAQHVDDRPRVVPIADPPDGWVVDGDRLEGQEIFPDMAWQVGGNVVSAGGVVDYRLPYAWQPAGTPIPEWPQIIASGREIVNAEEFAQLGKAYC